MFFLKFDGLETQFSGTAPALKYKVLILISSTKKKVNVKNNDPYTHRANFYLRHSTESSGAVGPQRHS